ncbi:N-6 DNA methylase [Halomonas sp. AOP42-E1-30]|uniref:N-6 DNA methylase n=1 Tax=Halomonas sp. AOP42-E1-30 TaxID=3457665 RepID=UPI004033A429
MSLDTAIKNVGDYYAAHYLADKNGFRKDIADKVKGWKEQGSQSAPRKLAALSETYFKAKTEALSYEDPFLRGRADNETIKRWHPTLLNAMGYQPEPFGLVLESEQKQVPVLHRLSRHNQPWLVITEAPFCLTDGENDEEPLEQDVIPRTRHVDGLPALQDSWEKAIALLFKQEDSPRWVMLLAGGRIYLFDAHTFAQGRYLWIDLDEAYGRRQAATFEAIAALLSDEALVPQGESDEVLHERLREGSLKSTHGVSEKLQGAVRDAIEAIANGWVEARRQNNLGYRRLNDREDSLPDGSREITAEKLRHDALIYVYRLLFCFYAEARGGELGILPINDDVYRLGYSLESLRDLVDANEPGTTTENGTYITEHLERLFQLIYDGFDPERESTADEQTGSPFSQAPRQESLFGAPSGEQLSLKGAGIGRSKYTPGKVFAIQPLTATLFDPQSTPLLSRVKLPNRILHKVVRCLSLGISHQSKRVGRINYAELGIVQLGSVYEGLLSYKGFFAAEDLIQVHQKAKNGKPMLDNAIDAKVPTWFVPAHRENEFKASEIVLEHRTERTRIYRTGEFILHLNGVDRVNSASYYTPEVLTRTLVEEALKERLKDFAPEQADDILDLKICEPAMGSAAFLVEAIDQLAHHYLELKQKQVGESIDPSNYEDELRRVRHYIAVHNVYGVDLNPVAVELGALSLWLSTIHRLKVSEGDEDNQPLFIPAATPWFGLRLRAGNSLIGARRSVWKKDQLLRGKYYGKNAEIPRQLKPGEDRQPGEIYHFLVWDEDMTPAASDKLMKEHWPDECDAINTWRKKQVKTKCSVEEVVRLERLSERIDELWKDYSIARQQALADTACTSSVWPKAQNSLEALRSGPTLRRQEGLKASLEAESGAFQRLKLLMDSWCSLYFWPLDQSDNLPSREAWLAAAEVLLGIGTDDLATRAMLDIQLGEEIELEALFQASEQKLPDAEHLSGLVPWYEVGRTATADQNFHHWELIFTEVLGPKVHEEVAPKGFDLIFGNPPWLKVTWSDSALLNEFEPKLGVRGAKSADYNRERPNLIDTPERKRMYGVHFERDEGSNVFLNDVTLYPYLAGVQTNLYKNFVEKSWRLLAEQGVSGFVHEEGVYTDSSGGRFREELYTRLRAHYQFINKLSLFNDVKENKLFSINIYRGKKGPVGFISIANLYHPKTIIECHNEARRSYNVPGLRDSDGKPETVGHPSRKIYFDLELLSVVKKVFDPGQTELMTRLPSIHSNFAISVIRKIAASGRFISDLDCDDTEFFHEANAQRENLIKIMRNPVFSPSKENELVMVMSHITHACPFGKSPVSGDSAQVQYEELDLYEMPDGYIPSSIYCPDKTGTNLSGKYLSKIPQSRLRKETRKFSDTYRLAWRRRSQPDDTRTLICSVIPPRVAHVNNIVSVDFEDLSFVPLVAGCSASIIFDFFIKSFNKSDVWFDAVRKLPVVEGVYAELIISRSLRLSCITESFGDLWQKAASQNICEDSWASENPTLENCFDAPWSALKKSEWFREFSLTSDIGRRQAVLEIDVLVALALGIELDELLTIYKHYFSTFKKYDENDEFDMHGQRLPNYVRQSPGRAEMREAKAVWGGTSPITISWYSEPLDKTITRTFQPPFAQVDRIEDYRTAYRLFSKRLGLTENNKEPI